jgi:hypothetical protein
MLKKILLALVSASVVRVSKSYAATFADEVVSYNPGVGTALNYTNVATVLGEPSRVNPFGDAVEPFNPPYGRDQILSIGTGGSVTVKFHTPVLNHPKNQFGLDFIIFGNSGFIITNDFDFTTFDWVGIPATDGSLFGQSFGETRISVSRDGINFYQLNPALAPTVDKLFPTDGEGDFQTPVDPSLTQNDIAGATADHIALFYNGSAGGAGYDISWAQDANGRSVNLPEIRYIRVDVLSDKAEIDGFATVKGPRKN